MELCEPLWNNGVDPLKTAVIGFGLMATIQAAMEPVIDPSIPVCQPREMCAPLPSVLGDEPASKLPEPLVSEPAVSGTISTVNLSARTMIKISAVATINAG
jgi:hypothetical protein